jgi:hypothetical protein
MGASGFGTLAGHFDDCTVATYDPRGAERGRVGQQQALAAIEPQQIRVPADPAAL